MARILIVEDDEGLLAMMQLVLQRAGYEVLTATDGMEGIRQATQLKPEVVVLDLMMPWAAGDAVLGFIRATRTLRNMRVVVVSAHPNAQQIAQQLGADCCLSKPVDMHVLTQQIKAVLGNGAG